MISVSEGYNVGLNFQAFEVTDLHLTVCGFRESGSKVRPQDVCVRVCVCVKCLEGKSALTHR